jgi:nitrite reductase (NADH) small subunit
VPEFVPVCRLDEIPEGRAKLFDVAGASLAVFRVGATCHALASRCPHAGGTLGHGWVEDGEAVCPLHRWRFRLTDGRCTTIRGEWVRAYPCEARDDGQVWVAV